MKFLIADDEHINRQLLLRLLSPYGECTLAVNGRMALDNLEQMLSEGQTYDLVCLDIMMPVMDGLETLQELRKLENELKIDPARRTKVLMTTALSDRDFVVQALHNQCHGYLVKPISGRRLKLEMQKLELLEQSE